MRASMRASAFFVGLVASVAAMDCGVDQYYSPNMDTCVVNKAEGDYCNSVIMCTSGLSCTANVCEMKCDGVRIDPSLPMYGGSVPCAVAEAQSPRDVSADFVGLKEVYGLPISRLAVPKMKHVNTHFHLGTEHKSAGEYDIAAPDGVVGLRSGGELRPGWFCENKLTEEQNMPYEFEHCKHVEVGNTYEFHWVYSSGGTHLKAGLGGAFDRQMNPNVVVQGQMFVIANDATGAHSYDMLNGETFNMLGEDVVAYLGSTTGGSYNNDVCSPVAISWHVDRKCQVVSAQSVDAMCKMMSEDWDMEADAEPHSSRETVDDVYSAEDIHPATIA